ncbi:MAG: histidine phosphatase family protein [Anaerolineales bacterium]|nr:histidine phosphatase family protein [Anaerolineales bacterium]
MRTLLLLRHAKSSWKEPALADYERPLSRRGRRDAPRMGALLVEMGLEPEWICCSSAKRARQTAEAVMDACRYDGEIEYREDLYHAGLGDFLEAIRDLPADCTRVLLIGHNPGLEELLDWLTDESEWLPTAALAQIELNLDAWQDLLPETQGRLRGLWRPKELI